MIDCLIFSKNRACQLDALLRSIEHYAADLYATITVLWTETELQFAQAYCTTRIGPADVWDSHYGAAGFYESFWHWFNNTAGDRISFLVDDDLFFRPVPKNVLDYTHVSLRLGLNTTYSQPMGVEQKLTFERSNPLHGGNGVLYTWPGAEGDFGYPLSLDGDIYRRSDIEPLFNFDFGDPTQLEAGLAAQADGFLNPWTWMPRHSCLVSVPANRVTVSSHNPCSNDPALSAEALNERFLNGERIDFLSMDFSDVRAAHQLIPYAWA